MSRTQAGYDLCEFLEDGGVHFALGEDVATLLDAKVHLAYFASPPNFPNPTATYHHLDQIGDITNTLELVLLKIQNHELLNAGFMQIRARQLLREVLLRYKEVYSIPDTVHASRAIKAMNNLIKTYKLPIFKWEPGLMTGK